MFVFCICCLVCFLVFVIFRFGLFLVRKVRRQGGLSAQVGEDAGHELGAAWAASRVGYGEVGQNPTQVVPFGDGKAIYFGGLSWVFTRVHIAPVSNGGIG